MANNEDSDTTVLVAINQWVRKADQRKRLAPFAGWRADTGELFKQFGYSLELVKKPARQTRASFNLIAASRFDKIVSCEPVDRPSHLSSARSPSRTSSSGKNSDGS